MKAKSHKSRGKRFVAGIIISYCFVAVFASLLANEKPLFISINGKNYFPAFSNDPYIELTSENGTVNRIRTGNVDWKNIPHERIIFPPVRWSPVHSDLLNIYSSPFDDQKIIINGETVSAPFWSRHFLGTGKTGNDVLSGLIHGTRTSITIGLLSVSIAMFIGIIIGGLAGYLGDTRLKVSRGSAILSVIMIIPSWFYAFYLRSEIIGESFSSSIFSGTFQILISILLFILIFSWPFLLKFSFIPALNKKIQVPVDTIVSRCIEIFLSLPRLVLILAFAAITRPSVLSIILIIGLTSWTEIARLIRAMVLQLREMNYVDAARSMGVSTPQIIYRHLFPNTISQLFVFWTFGIASAILIETGLSFLGIGVPVGTATWGSLMYEARENYHAWWLVIFSGMAISLLLSSLYFTGNKFRLRSSKKKAFS